MAGQLCDITEYDSLGTVVRDAKRVPNMIHSVRTMLLLSSLWYKVAESDDIDRR